MMASRLSIQASVPAAKRGHLPTLDGWRAISILMLLFCHCGIATYVMPGGLYENAHISDLIFRCNICVNVFFALSGLLICTLILRDESKTGTIDLPGFYIKRCFRILPAYLAYLGTLAVLHLVTGQFTLNRAEWASCLLIWRNYLPQLWMSPDRWYLAHFWTLSVEEQFYLIWPTLLFFLGRGRARTAAICLSILVAGWRAFSHHAAIDPRLDSLFWGCAVAITIANARERRLLERFLTPLNWGVLALIVCIGNFWRLKFSLVWIPVALPFLIAGTMLNPHWYISRLLDHPVLVWIAKISYGLYIWQELFLVGGHERVKFMGILQVFPFNFIASFTLGALSWYFFEKPLLSYGRRLASTRRSRLDKAHPKPAELHIVQAVEETS
jgi:peptidoglycan/LPS O-acetylase OafA/YrhL